MVPFLLVTCVLASSLALPQTTKVSLSRPRTDLRQKRSFDDFCHSYFEYDDVTFEVEDSEMCWTEFEKVCEERSQYVCADVTDTTCKVAPYAACAMEMQQQPMIHTEMELKEFDEKCCKSKTKVVQHLKDFPVCENVTKKNCVTLWNTDSAGRKVWAGEEDCEDVTWKECKLEKRKVDFEVPEIICTDCQKHYYEVPKEVPSLRMTNSFGCQVKSSVDCVTTTRPDCETITWQECKEVPSKNCKDIQVKTPVQEKQHKKKCVLD